MRNFPKISRIGLALLLAVASCSHFIPEDPGNGGSGQSISLLSPTNGQVVTNGFPLSAKAANAQTLLNLSLQVVSVSSGNTNVLPATSVSGNIAAVLNIGSAGLYKVRLRVIDSKNGLVESPEIKVSLVATPSLVFSSPASNGQIVATNTFGISLDGVGYSPGAPVGSVRLTYPPSAAVETWPAVSGAFSIPLTNLVAGTNSLEAVARTVDGIDGAPGRLTVIVDTNPPALVVTAPFAGQNVGSVYAISGSASDPLSGIGAVMVSHSYGPFTFAVLQGASWNLNLEAASGVITDRIFALDRAGNSSATNEIVVNRSSLPWVIPASPANGSWVGANFFTFSGEAGASLFSTLALLEIRVNGVLERSVATPPSSWSFLNVPLSQEGSNRIDIRVSDSKGQVVDAPPYYLIRDTAIPTLTPLFTLTWWTNSAALDLPYTASDASSGIATLSWSLNSDTSVNASGGVIRLSALPEGTNSLAVWALDQAGNSSVTQVLTLLEDYNGPSVATAGLPPFTNVTHADFPIAVSDNLSGFVSNVWRVNGGVWCGTTGTVIAASNFTTGANTIDVVSFDAAGNAGPTATVGVTLDQAPPSVSQTAFTNNQIVGSFFVVGGTISDAVAGPYRLYVKTNSGPWYAVSNFTSGLWSRGFSVFVVGWNDIYWYASDKAGNIDATNQVKVFADAVPSVGITNLPTFIFTNLSSLDLSGIASILPPYSIDGVALSVNGGAYSAIPDMSFSTNGVALPLEGSNTIRLKATSGAKTNYSSLYTVVRDTVKPVVGFTSLPLYGTNPAPSVTLTVAEVLSGLNTFEYRQNGGGWNNALVGSQTLALVEGSNSFDFSASDFAGNVSLPTNFVTVLDTVAPTLSIWPGISGFTNVNVVNFALSVIETNSGLRSNYYSVNMSADTAFVQTNIGIGPMGEGAFNIRFRSDDLAGNSSPYVAFTLVADYTAPVLTTNQSFGAWTNTASVTVVPAIVESLSGFGALVFDTNGSGVFTNAGASLTLSSLPDGSNLLHLAAYDLAGNLSSPIAIWVPVDVTPPVVGTNAGLNEFTNQTSLAVSLSQTDPASGVASNLILTNGAAFWMTGASFTFTGTNGTNSIQLSGIDVAGNLSVPQNVTVVMDTAAPVIYTNAGLSAWTNTLSVTVDTASTDLYSGVASNRADANGVVSSFTGSFPFTGTNGLNHLSFQAFDYAGNASAVLAIPLGMDTAVPVPLTNDGFPVWTNTSSVVVSFTITDAYSGVLSNYGIGNGVVSAFGLNYGFVGTNGLNSLSFGVFDNAGNSATLAFTLGIDTAAPVVTAVPVNTLINAQNASIGPVITDAFSGVSRTWYSYDGGTAVEYTNSFLLLGMADGSHSIAVWAMDNAWNISATVTQNFTVDTVPPAIVILSPTNGQVLFTNNLVANVLITNGDNIGVASIRMTVDPALTNTFAPGGPLMTLGKVLTEGSNQITMIAEDTAGNIATNAVIVEIYSNVYVKDTANNGDPGSKGLPIKNIQTAVDLAASNGVNVCVAGGGEYKDGGQLNAAGSGVVISNGNLGILGGWNPAFTARDPTMNPTYVNAGHALLHAFEINGATNVTLDGFLIANGDANGAGGLSNAGGGVLVSDSSDVLLTNLRVTNCSANFGGGVYIGTSTKLLLYADVLDNRAPRGAGVLVKDSSFVEIGGAVHSNDNTPAGGGGTFGGAGVRFEGTLSNRLTANVFENHSFNHGGGVYAFSNDFLSLEGNIISNSSDIHGGGLFMDKGLSNVVSSPTGWNKAGTNGGGWFFNDTLCLTVSATGMSNTAGNQGGGLFGDKNFTLVFTGGLYGCNSGNEGGGAYLVNSVSNSLRGWIANCSALTNAGGLMLNRGKFIYVSSPVISNTAGWNGGGLLVLQSGDLLLTNFTNAWNLAANSGGGIQLESGTNVELADSYFYCNRAAEDGGALGIFNSSNFAMRNTGASGNTGGDGTVAFVVDSCKLTFDSGAWDSNNGDTATNQGGTLLLMRSPESTVFNVQMLNNTTLSNDCSIRLVGQVGVLQDDWTPCKIVSNIFSSHGTSAVGISEASGIFEDIKNHTLKDNGFDTNHLLGFYQDSTGGVIISNIATINGPSIFHDASPVSGNYETNF